MTVKSRGSAEASLEVSKQEVSSGNWYDSVSGPKGPAIYHEYISSDTPNFKRYGNCRHIKWEGSPSYQTLASSLWNYQGCSHRRGIYPVFSTIDWAQLNAEAYLTMKPSLSSGFSLTNFLVELKELKMLFSLWKRSKTLLQNAASAHLNWNFGWKPFIGDLITMHRKLVDMESTLLDYKSKQGKTMVRHFEKRLPQETYNDVHAETSTYDRTISAKRNGVFHATMKFKYWVPKIDQEYAKIKGILDVLGLRITPSIVWELIPFSFVVDWFINVGDYLRSLETDFLESVVRIEDFCCSVKTEVTGKQIGQYDGYAKADLFYFTISEYVRRRMLPEASDFGLAQTHRYGKKQILLSAALLIA